MNIFFSIGIKIFSLCALKFGGHAASQFSFVSQYCCGTVLFAPNPLPLKKRAAGFPLQSLARGGVQVWPF
jgi:hypothetical protein